MTELEKMNYAIELGWRANPETGEILTHKGKILKANSNGYIRCSIGINSKIFGIYGHRFIFYVFYGKLPENHIDHINGDKSDNRITNLRDVTIQENHKNRTTAKGYYWNKRDKKWYAKIALNYKIIHLGYFDSEVEARQAYLDAKKIYHKID